MATTARSFRAGSGPDGPGLVQGWHLDHGFTDAARALDIAYFDRGSINPAVDQWKAGSAPASASAGLIAALNVAAEKATGPNATRMTTLAGLLQR